MDKLSQWIELSNILCTYPLKDQPDVQALSIHNLQINRGEFIAIVGSNGSGKTTLARLINGLRLPQEGRVTVDGKITANNDDLGEIRKKVGMVFQNPDNQLVAATCAEDIAFGLENLALEAEEIRLRVAKYLKKFHLEELKDQSPRLLSGGQKQRLAIAGVLAMEPAVLVLDEPTAMLDPEGRKDLLQLIIQIKMEKSCTILFITHHMSEALLADRVLVLHAGKIKLDGLPKEVLTQKEKLANYGLKPPEVVQLGRKLRDYGIELPSLPLNIDELVRELCGQWN